MGSPSFASFARLAVVGCCAVLVLSACDRGDAHVQSSSATPSTTDAASLIVSIEDVRRIADFNNLAVARSGEHTRPSHFAHDEVPEPCRPSYQEDVAFGTGWTQFHSAIYFGKTDTAPGRAQSMVDIIQSAGVYPDPGSARAAFDRIASSLTICEGLHAPRHEITLDKQDPARLVVDFGGMGIAFRVKSAVLVEVPVVGLPNCPQVAADVSRAMIGRVR